MGKSIRAKIKKRLRTAKRQRIDAMLVTPREEEHFAELTKVIEGRSVRLSKPKNAFKYPEAAGAVFAQHEIIKPIDFRASHLPGAGFAFRGNRRKYDGEQAEYMKSIAKDVHPDMEVLAGGGAIDAKTGQRVTTGEAELQATLAHRPDLAAIAMAGPSSSSSAVSAAVDGKAAEEPSAAKASAIADFGAYRSKGGEGGDDDMDDEAPEVVPTNEADTSRRPVVKDTRRSNRLAAHRPRANATKKSKAVNVKGGGVGVAGAHFISAGVAKKVQGEGGFKNPQKNKTCSRAT